MRIYNIAIFLFSFLVYLPLQGQSFEDLREKAEEYVTKLGQALQNKDYKTIESMFLPNTNKAIIELDGIPITLNNYLSKLKNNEISWSIINAGEPRKDGPKVFVQVQIIEKLTIKDKKSDDKNQIVEVVFNNGEPAYVSAKAKRGASCLRNENSPRYSAPPKPAPKSSKSIPVPPKSIPVPPKSTPKSSKSIPVPPKPAPKSTSKPTPKPTPCPKCEQCPPPPPRPIINKDSIFSALYAQFIKNNPQLGILPPLTNNRYAYETVIRNRIQELYEETQDLYKKTKINLDFKNAEKPLKEIVEQLSEDFPSVESTFIPNANNSSVTVNNKTSETLIEGLYGQVEDLNKKLDLARKAEIKVYFKIKGKKEKIYLTENGLSRADYRKYKDRSVDTIYVEFPIQEELFPEDAKIAITMKNGEKDIFPDMTKHPLPISDIDSSSLNFEKTQIKYESLDVVISIYFDELNLIKIPNDTCNGKGCYKFVIYKDENNTHPDTDTD